MTVDNKLQICDPANSTKMLMKQLANDDGSMELAVNTDDMLNKNKLFLILISIIILII